MDEEIKRVFTPRPMALFRSSRKLSSYLVRVKLYPMDRMVGSKIKYNKPRCLLCVNVTETNTFTNTVTGKTYKVNHKIDCEVNCLVYLFTSTVVFSTLDKLFLSPVTDEITIMRTVENTRVMKIVSKIICMITMCLVIKIFLI